jgi:hypothetical protein
MSYNIGVRFELFLLRRRVEGVGGGPEDAKIPDKTSFQVFDSRVGRLLLAQRRVVAERSLGVNGILWQGILKGEVSL